MNPFEWRGPQFLLFYLVLAVVAVCVNVSWRAGHDQLGNADKVLADPYLLAYLRGGRLEALRVALVTFLYEGLITLDSRVVTRAVAAPRRALVPVEAEVWDALHRARTLEGLAKDEVGRNAGLALRARLEQMGYLRSQRVVDAGARLARWTTLLLLAVVVTKIGIGISRDRPVGFLIFLTLVVALIGAVKNRLSPITSRGESALASVRALLDDARKRLDDVTLLRDDEVVMLVAAFGLAFMIGKPLPFMNALFPVKPLTGAAHADFSWGHPFVSNSGSGSSDGSSSSSCGSSCGGGCGGGGCGGCGS